MTEGYADAAEWARVVQVSEPHDLAEVERHVLGQGPGSAARHATTRPSSARDNLNLVIGLVLIVGPTAAATVFWDRSGATRLDYYIEDGVAFPVAATGGLLGALLVVLALADWVRRVRRRDAALVATCAAVALCGVLALVAASSRTSTGQVPELVYVAPLWLSAALGVLGTGVGVLAPAKDRAEAKAVRARERLHLAKIKATHGDLDELHPVLVEALMDDRRRALAVLASRGMLPPGVDVSSVADRPLGQLARGTEDGT